MSFANKRYVVTGVSSGVGKATAKLLREAGAVVVGIDVNEADGACDEFIHCDLSSPSSIDEAVLQIADPVHGLANIAGVPGSLPRDLVFKVNYLGLRRLTDALLPKLESGASVVNCASTAGAGWRARQETSLGILKESNWDKSLSAFEELALDGPATYDFTKELVILYTMLISSSERHRRVRVNSVSPGAVQTPILKDFYNTMGSDLLGGLKQQAGGRDAHPEEIAQAILLMLDAKGFWINGTDLIVDGGAEVSMNLGKFASAPLPLE